MSRRRYWFANSQPSNPLSVSHTKPGIFAHASFCSESRDALTRRARSGARSRSRPGPSRLAPVGRHIIDHRRVKESGDRARGSEQSGMATDLVHQASDRTSALASWLEQREPGHVVEEVTRFAPATPRNLLGARRRCRPSRRPSRPRSEAASDDSSRGPALQGPTATWGFTAAGTGLPPGAQWAGSNPDDQQQ
jgi:hypothetical protein